MKAKQIGLAMGLIAAVAVVLLGISAYRFVRRSSEDLGVSSHQLRAALDQFFFVYPEKNIARYEDIYGPDKFVKGVNPVAGEDYHECFPVRRGYRELVVTARDGRRLILFDGGLLDQDPDGEFTPRFNRNRERLDRYLRWIKDGKPLEVEPQR